MSADKAQAIAALPPAERAAYHAKRNARAPWQRLSKEDWEEYCAIMAEWYDDQAKTQFDAQKQANEERKAASDEVALKRVVEQRVRARSAA